MSSERAKQSFFALAGATHESPAKDRAGLATPGRRTRATDANEAAPGSAAKPPRRASAPATVSEGGGAHRVLNTQAPHGKQELWWQRTVKLRHTWTFLKERCARDCCVHYVAIPSLWEKGQRLLSAQYVYIILAPCMG